MHKPQLLLPILCVTLTSCTTDSGEEVTLPPDKTQEVNAESAAVMSAEELASKMVDAYRSAPVHQESQVWAYEPVAVEGGTLTRPSRTTVEVLMDRKYDRLRLRIVQEYEEMPEENRESLLVATENRLLYKNSDYPGRHLAAELPELSYSALMDALPMLGSKKPLPILALLLSEEPLQAVCGGQAPHLETVDADRPGQPKLALESDQRNLMLRLDPETWLITEARLEETLPSGVGGTHQAVSSYQVTAERSPEPPEGAMVFEAGVSKAVSTFQEFLKPVE